MKRIRQKIEVTKELVETCKKNEKFQKALLPVVSLDNREGRRKRGAIWRRALRAAASGRDLDAVSYSD